jgi:hypothetical protein
VPIGKPSDREKLALGPLGIMAIGRHPVGIGKKKYSSQGLARHVEESPTDETSLHESCSNEPLAFREDYLMRRCQRAYGIFYRLLFSAQQEKSRVGRWGIGHAAYLRLA